MDYNITYRWTELGKRTAIILLVSMFTISPGSSKEVVETKDFVEEAYIHSYHQVEISTPRDGGLSRTPVSIRPEHNWQGARVTEGTRRSKLYIWHSSLKLFD